VSVGGGDGRQGCKQRGDKGTRRFCEQRGQGGSCFPKDFLWGAATASYQFAGAANEDARASRLGLFCKKKGASRGTHWGRRLRITTTATQEDFSPAQAWARSPTASASLLAHHPQGVGTSEPEGVRLLNVPPRRLDPRRTSVPSTGHFPLGLPGAAVQGVAGLNRDSRLDSPSTSRITDQKLGDRVKPVERRRAQCFIGGSALLDGLHAPGDNSSFRSTCLAAHTPMRVARPRACSAARARQGLEGRATCIALRSRSRDDKPEDVEAAAASPSSPSTPR